MCLSEHWESTVVRALSGEQATPLWQWQGRRRAKNTKRGAILEESNGNTNGSARRPRVVIPECGQ
jgi:hypothetical protein